MKYDICVLGGCSLHLPFFMREDGTYSNTPDSIVLGGKGANQAVAASRAGARTTIITRLGNDENGRKIKENLIQNNIDVSNVTTVGGLENDLAKVFIDKNGDNLMKRSSDASNSFYPEMIYENKDVLLNSKIILAQLKMPREVLVELVHFCHQNNLKLVVTPTKPEELSVTTKENIELLDKISYITLNQSEFEVIFQTIDYMKYLMKYPNKLFITLSKDGMIYYDGKEKIHYEAVEVPKVVDRTGAGDTYCGNFAASLALEGNIDEAIKRAMFASAYKVQSKTAQAGMPTFIELNTFIEEEEEKCNGLLRRI